MKKKIMALLAAIATVFGLGFAASTAMAADYAPAIQGTTSYDAKSHTLTATVNSDGAVSAGYKYVYASYDSTMVSDVQLAAAYDRTQYVGEATSDVFKVNIKLTDAAAQGGSKVYVKIFLSRVKGAASDLQAMIDSGDAIQVKGNEQDGSLSFSIPQVGPAEKPAGSTTAKTGADVAPYAVAVVLLAAAGIALMAVRKSTAR